MQRQPWEASVEYARGIAFRKARMTTTPATTDEICTVPTAVDPGVQHEIEQFLYLEAELLDDRRFRDWFGLLADDLRYYMPTRANRTFREMDKENSIPGQIALFDDDKTTMRWRVNQLESGTHWAEDPPSRTRHLVTNIRIQPTDVDHEYVARSNFLCYRNRLDTETDIWVGDRCDLLRNVGPRQWQIVNRYILLDQNVVLSKNQSVFI